MQLGDVYVRLPFSGMDWPREQPHSGSLVFVDIDSGGNSWTTVDTWFRNIPESLLALPHTLLFRYRRPGGVNDWPDPGDAVHRVSQLMGERRFAQLQIGAIEFPVGTPPVIHGAWEQADWGRLLNRARRVELMSLLDAAGAIWRPRDYHYRLPSGHHSGEFVRIAEAFRHPRAAGALATWLFAGFRSGGTVVVDSGTLTPLVAELSAAAQNDGLLVGPQLRLDEYPTSKFEYRVALRNTDSDYVLAIMSISSTGSSHTGLVQVLRETVAEWRCERLAARKGPVATEVPTGAETGDQSPWVHIDSLTQPLREKDCALCRDARSARLVYIDPQSFEPMALPEPTFLRPNITDAKRNRSLWEEYDRITVAGGAAPLRLTGQVSRGRSLSRPVQQRGLVLFEPAELLRSDRASTVVEARWRAVEALQRAASTDPVPDRVRRARGLIAPTDAIIIHHDDAKLFAGMPEGAEDAVPENDMEGLAAGLASIAGQVPVLQWPHDAHRLYEDSRKLLLFATGLRSGVTLQRLLAEVRGHFTGATPDLAGLVLHAHPHDSRVWDAVRNSFKNDAGEAAVMALWLTYVPPRSPLTEELDHLNAFDESSLEPATVTLVQARRKELSDNPTPRPFWGADIRVRPTSYYGSLGSAALLAAVGSAMHTARLEARTEGVPHWALFDMPRIFRSYFDGVIHAAVLRWLAPHEAWWGARDGDCDILLREIDQRSSEADRRVLIPELLLAAAMGKLPEEGIETAISLGETFLSGSAGDEETHRYVHLGVAMARDARP